ncbi:MAG: Do family serine endopeptidase [Hyphomicrobiales bacterium]
MTGLLHSRKGLLGLVAAGLLGATALSTEFVLSPPPAVHAEQPSAVAPQAGFADLADKVMPAVVSVRVDIADVSNEDDNGDQAPPQAMPNLPPDSPFRDFFNQFPQFRNQPQQPRRGMAEGSGFIISPDGYAVTNNHVVRNADKVTVTTSEGDEYSADVIGTDAKTDLALLKIKASNKTFQYVQFAQKEPRVGDWVLAVGNPFGLGGTVTTGIISARGRDIGSGPYDDFLQIDAPINRGNSGGPAFNLDGDVIGVNTAIFSPSGGSVGIGFAIPASTAQSVIESLKTNGTVTRGWLGVQIQPVTDEIAEGMNLTAKKGALVADVTEGSPALAAGIKTGDTILKVDGQDVSDPRDLAKKVARIAPGKSVPMTIVRDGKTMDVSVEIGKMPNDQMASAKPAEAAPTSMGQLGLKLAPAQDGAGVTVVDVAPDSPAAEKGIKSGDVILEIGGKEVHRPADVQQALSGMKKENKRVVMLVRSGDSQRYVALPPNKG